MERDEIVTTTDQGIVISTHTLTWSVTIPQAVLDADAEISTHTLTWSVTAQCSRGYTNPCNFNSHAHVERDGFWKSSDGGSANFNSHAHVERDVKIGGLKNMRRKFQLTRSRGA